MTVTTSNTNQWLQLAQQGLCMFGGNSMGYGMSPFGNLTSGCGIGNILSNCNGEINYEAMAGFGVANAIINFGFQAWQTHQSSKEAEVSMSDLRSIDTQIIDKQTEINKLKGKKASLETELEEAKEKRTSLDTAAAEAEQNYNNAKTAYKNATQIKVGIDINPKTGESYTQDAIDSLVKQLQDTMDAKKRLYYDAKNLKEANDKILDNNPEKIKKLGEDIETAKGELEKLEASREGQYGKLSEKDQAKYRQTRFVICERNVRNAETEEEKAEAQKELYNEADRLVKLYESSDKAKKEIPEVICESAKKFTKNHPELNTK